jgi:integrase
LQCQRVLAIPSKRYERGPVEFLTEEETAALVATPDPGTWIGRRDKALLLLAAQTGLRNSAVLGLLAWKGGPFVQEADQSGVIRADPA